MSISSGKNTLEFTTPYYVFEARDPAYKNIRFIPKIFVTRINSETIQVFVQLYKKDLITKKVQVVRSFFYEDKVKNENEYFRALQNSNFSFGLPSPLLFLENAIKTVQQSVNAFSANKKSTSGTVYVNTIPTSNNDNLPSPPYFSTMDLPPFTSPLTLTALQPPIVLSGGTWSCNDGTAKLTPNPDGTCTFTLNNPTYTGLTIFSYTTTNSTKIPGTIYWGCHAFEPNGITLAIFNTGVFTLTDVLWGGVSDFNVGLCISNQTDSPASTTPFSIDSGDGKLYCQAYNWAGVQVKYGTSTTVRYDYNTTGSYAIITIDFFIGYPTVTEVELFDS